jgi:hypothetical protein
MAVTVLGGLVELRGRKEAGRKQSDDIWKINIIM